MYLQAHFQASIQRSIANEVKLKLMEIEFEFYVKSVSCVLSKLC